MIQKEWNRVTRVDCDGAGAHVYVKGRVLRKAFELAGIPMTSRNLVARCLYMVPSLSGYARVVIEIRVDDQGVIKDAEVEEGFSDTQGNDH